MLVFMIVNEKKKKKKKRENKTKNLVLHSKQKTHQRLHIYYINDYIETTIRHQIDRLIKSFTFKLCNIKTPIKLKFCHFLPI